MLFSLSEDQNFKFYSQGSILHSPPVYPTKLNSSILDCAHDHLSNTIRRINLACATMHRKWQALPVATVRIFNTVVLSGSVSFSLRFSSLRLNAQNGESRLELSA